MLTSTLVPVVLGNRRTVLDSLFAAGLLKASLQPARCLSRGQLWQDTGKASQAAAGSVVRVMADGSAGADLSAPTNSARPTLLTDDGSHYFLRFDGSDDVLGLASLALPQPVTLVGCLRVPSLGSAGTNDTLFSAGDGGGPDLETRTSNTLCFAGSGGLTYTPLATATVLQVTVIWSGASSVLRVNGVQVATGDAGTNAGSAVGFGGRYAGTRNAAVDWYGAGVCSGSLTAPQLAAAEAEVRGFGP